MYGHKFVKSSLLFINDIPEEISAFYYIHQKLAKFRKTTIFLPVYQLEVTYIWLGLYVMNALS